MDLSGFSAPGFRLYSDPTTYLYVATYNLLFDSFCPYILSGHSHCKHRISSNPVAFYHGREKEIDKK